MEDYIEERVIQDGKLNFEEFKDYVFMYISIDNLSNTFYQNNTMFCESIFLEVWHSYLNSNVHQSVFSKNLESFFHNFFRYKPVADNSEYKD